MPWFKVDDQFWSHPKVVECSDAAIALWVRAGSYASQHLTNGRITHGTLRMLASSREVADELVLAGLWDQLDARTWEFHDWESYQPTREVTESTREAKHDASVLGNHIRWHEKRGIRIAECPHCDPNRIAPAITDGSLTGESQQDSQTLPPSPSRPRTTTHLSESQSRDTRASASTDSEEVSEMTRRLAAQQGITSLQAVIDAVAKHAHRTISADTAYRLSLHILQKSKRWPDAPQRYVTGAISRSQFEIQKFIDSEAA